MISCKSPRQLFQDVRSGAFSAISDKYPSECYRALKCQIRSHVHFPLLFFGSGSGIFLWILSRLNAAAPDPDQTEG